ncbi:MAG: 30S ribosomal protein S8 [Patescibacteria group bacterium]
MNSDPIADFIIQLKNAALSAKPSVVVPASNLKLAIAEKLIATGFLKGVAKKGKKTKKYLEVELAYVNGSPKIAGVKRVSKTSRRVYLGNQSIRPFRQGFGQMILSTPKGILTGDEARTAKVGGEALFTIW